MFNSTKEKVLVVLIVLLIIIIPSGSFLIAQRNKSQNQANKKNQLKPVTQAKEVPPTSPLDDLKKSTASSSSSSLDSAGSLSGGGSFGPTLSFKVNLEGRSKDKQATKMFVGIVQGSQISMLPQFLLSFNVDVPESGAFSTLSLSGLSTLDTYTAILKSPAQIATSSAFSVKPTVTDIGTLNFLTGDLNEDNVINSADYVAIKLLSGTNSKSTNWNPNADFNKDGVINNIDIAYIIKNFGKTGASGPWYSTTTKVASGSGELKGSNLEGSASARTGGPDSSPPPQDSGVGGYWLWVPKSR